MAGLDLMSLMKKPNRYNQIIEQIFLDHYVKGATEVVFEREEIAAVAERLGVTPPKNVGDAIYSFRYRTDLPEAIRSRAPKGTSWIIRSAGGHGIGLWRCLSRILLHPK